METTSLKRKFACEEEGCRYTCLKRAHLERHHRTHTQERSFLCSFCERPFARLDSRDRHVMRWHSQQRVETGGGDEVAASDGERHEVVAGRLDNARPLDISPHGVEGLPTPSSLPFQVGSAQNSIRNGTEIDCVVRSDGSAAETTHPLHSIEGDPGSSSSAHDFLFGGLEHEANIDNPFSEPVVANVFWEMLNASLAGGPPNEGLVTQDTMFDGEWGRVRQHDWPLMNACSASAVSSHWPAGLELQPARSDAYSVPRNDQEGDYASQRPLDSRSVTPPEHRNAEEAPSLILKRMQRDIHSLARRIKPPAAPSKVRVESCLWLCRRFFAPHSYLPVHDKPLQHYLARPSMLINLIAIGSLWSPDQRVLERGRQLWLFTIRVASSRDARLANDDATIADLLSLLYIGQSYVLMSNDSTVSHLGRRAWISTYTMLEERKSLVNVGLPTVEQLTAMDAEEREKAWTAWQRDEEGVRATMGLCAYDSQQALSMFRTPSPLTVLMHTRLPLPDELLEAPSEDAWLASYVRLFPSPLQHTPRFGALLSNLHKTSIDAMTPREMVDKLSWFGMAFSELTLSSLLEAIHVAWRLETDVNGRTSNFQKNSEGWYDETAQCGIMIALGNWARLWRYCVGNVPPSQGRHFLLERWHNIHLNLCFSSARVVSLLRLLPQREAGDIPRYRTDDSLESQASLETFRQYALSSSNIRQALFHAGAIFARFAHLGKSASFPVHVAKALFESAMVVALCCLVLRDMAPSQPPFELADPRQAAEVQVLCCNYKSKQRHTGCIVDVIHQQSSPLDVRMARWVKDGDTAQASFEGLSLAQKGHLVLQLMLDVLNSSNAKWCLSADCLGLLRSCLEELEQRRGAH